MLDPDGLPGNCRSAFVLGGVLAMVDDDLA
jgi:hypothetical protein